MSSAAPKTRLAVKVVPGASKSEIAGWLGEALKVRVSAPAEKGRANRAVEELVRGALGLPPHAVRVVVGTASPRKVLEIDGLSLAEIREKLRGKEIARVPAPTPTLTLYRPVGPEELELIAASGWTAFPPRLPEQPIFYPVLNEEYAAQIARDWNVRDSGAGYVTAFEIDSEYVARFEVRTVGGRRHQELWVPAEQLEEFNEHIVGPIRVIATFGDPSHGG